MEVLHVNTTKKEEIVNITKDVEKIIKGKTGVCSVFVRHASCALYINEDESGLKEDLLALMNKLVPEENWRHNRIDDNATAHLKSILLKQSIFVPMKDGKLMLGRWQTLFLVEFDGPREREIILDVG